MVVQLFCSAIYPSLYSMVNGFDMNGSNMREQAAPTNALSATGSDKHLASIATLMSSISSNNAAQSANNDKKEMIDCNNVPKDTCDQYSLKNGTFKTIAKSDLADFSNNLTVNTPDAQQQ